MATKIKSKKQLHTGEKVLCGYSKQERDAYKSLLETCDLIDCFRTENPDVIDQFTWFNIRIKNCFENNLGWLIDRFLVQKRFEKSIEDCRILSEIGVRSPEGTFISDHIPIFLEIK